MLPTKDQELRIRPPMLPFILQKRNTLTSKCFYQRKQNPFLQVFQKLVSKAFQLFKTTHKDVNRNKLEVRF